MIQNALAAIPFNRRSMYIHAIQSYLFNRFVSYRVGFGFDLMEGDFVCLDNENELTDKVSDREKLTIVFYNCYY